MGEARLRNTILYSVAAISLVFTTLGMQGCSVIDLIDDDDDSYPRPDTLFIDSEVVWSPSDGRIALSMDVFVTPEGRLEIKPGTEVEFVARTVVVPDPAGNMMRAPNLYVKGSIVCEGKQDSTIEFIGSSWHQIGGNIWVNHIEETGNEATFRWVNGIGNLNLAGGVPSVVQCVAEEIDIVATSWVVVDSCRLQSLFAYNDTKGIVSHNDFEYLMNVSGDSLSIHGNVFRSFNSPSYGAITCRSHSRAVITGNLIENCAVGILVFASSPTAHGNNFINNGVALAILPAGGAVQSDTLDFTGNWWGATGNWAIMSQIEYWRNGGYKSEKVIDYWPPADGPFSEGQSELH